MNHDDLNTGALAELLDRARNGDAQARDDLIRRAQQRLKVLARKMLRGYPTVHRWEDTADVLQNAMIRLIRALEVVTPQNTREFFGLAAEQIRRELIDMARHYQGPLGHARNYRSGVVNKPDEKPAIPEVAESAPDPVELERWAALHIAVEKLPSEEREVFMLTFYHGWKQRRIAELFDVDERTVRRWWRAAGVRLQETLGGQIPGG
jgi:RNA polymerase sigma factor (sigma-70 family)